MKVPAVMLIKTSIGPTAILLANPTLLVALRAVQVTAHRAMLIRYDTGRRAIRIDVDQSSKELDQRHLHCCIAVTSRSVVRVTHAKSACAPR
jgi:hypothetical protein